MSNHVYILQYVFKFKVDQVLFCTSDRRTQTHKRTHRQSDAHEYS